MGKLVVLHCSTESNRNTHPSTKSHNLTFGPTTTTTNKGHDQSWFKYLDKKLRLDMVNVIIKILKKDLKRLDLTT